MARMADSPRPWPRSLVTPITWTVPAEVTWIRTDTTPSMCRRVASAVYSGRGLKITLGAVRADAWATVGLGAGGGVTILGGAGWMMGTCCTILTSGILGGSGSLTSGSLILGGSTLTTGGGGILGTILGLMGSGSIFLIGAREIDSILFFF